MTFILRSPISFQSPLDVLDNTSEIGITTKISIANVQSRLRFALWREPKSYVAPSIWIEISWERSMTHWFAREIVWKKHFEMFWWKRVASKVFLSDFLSSERVQKRFLDFLNSKIIIQPNIIQFGGTQSSNDAMRDVFHQELTDFFKNYLYWQAKDCDAIFETFMSAIQDIQGWSIWEIRLQIIDKLKKIHPTTFMWARDYESFTTQTQGQITQVRWNLQTLMWIESQLQELIEQDELALPMVELNPEEQQNIRLIRKQIRTLKSDARTRIHQIMGRKLWWRVKDKLHVHRDSMLRWDIE